MLWGKVHGMNEILAIQEGKSHSYITQIWAWSWDLEMPTYWQAFVPLNMWSFGLLWRKCALYLLSWSAAEIKLMTTISSLGLLSSFISRLRSKELGKISHPVAEFLQTRLNIAWDRSYWEHQWQISFDNKGTGSIIMKDYCNNIQ